MPHHPSNSLPPEIDRLHRKLERMLRGDPTPVLDEESEQLVEVARHLQRHLPRDTIDPGFREQLKKDLIDPGPRLLPFRARSEHRYPVPAFAGALAVVMIAATAAGWMAFGDLLISSSSSEARASGASIGSVVAFATATATASDDGVVATAISSDAELAGASGSASLSQDATHQPIPNASGIELPPIDSAHIELGALSAARAMPSEAFDGVTFAMEGTLPSLDDTAPVYRFTTPFVNGDVLLRGVSDLLNIDGQIYTTEFHGRMAYTMVSDSGNARFTWFPLSGAFSAIVPPGEPAATDAEISTAAVNWLRAFGFPIDPASVKPEIQTLDNGQRLVHISIAKLPETALGHSVRVTLELDTEGRIVRASGYWLRLANTGEIAVVSAEEAWNDLRSGKGYWPDRPSFQGPGAFVADELEMTYLLTTDSASNGLVLQPVIAAHGTFTPEGSDHQIATTIYLQAAEHVVTS